MKRRKGRLACAYLDLAKAFDTVSHHHVSAGLECMGVAREFVEVVMDMYTGAHTRFRVGEISTGKIRIKRGVKQGDPLCWPR